MRNTSLFDLAFLARTTSAVAQTLDDFESYTPGQFLNGLNGGTGWDGAWVGRHGATGFLASDDFEAAALGSLSGQNTGIGWDGAWVTRTGANGLLAEDTFEAATLGGLNGQNTGTGWGGAWVSR